MVVFYVYVLIYVLIIDVSLMELLKAGPFFAQSNITCQTPVI
jgi:hypothetical protein